MSLNDVIGARVRAAVQAGTPANEITAPLLNNLALVAVAATRSSPPELRREALQGFVEILRNELDEAVAHYDQILPD